MATRTADGSFHVSFKGRIVNTPTAAEGGEVASASISKEYTVNFTSGTGANNIDRIWSLDKAVLGSSATDTINFFDITVTQGSGSDITDNIGFGSSNDNLGLSLGSGSGLVDVAGILVINSGSTTIKVVADTNAPPWFEAAADGVTIPSGGFFALGGGEDGGFSDMTTSTDAIDITNVDASAGEYSVVIFGRSA